MVQIIADLMALRPRLNLNATHFKDSYLTETECLKQQHDIMREIIRMQMRNEFEANNHIREYLERTYRMVMEQVENKWVYQRPEGLDQEVKQREHLCKIRVFIYIIEKGLTEESNPIAGATEASKDGAQPEQPKVANAKFQDPKEFAAYLGIPFASL